MCDFCLMSVLYSGMAHFVLTCFPLAFSTYGLVHYRHSINICCCYQGVECSEWERGRKGYWEKENKLHKNGVCGLVCIYCLGKIMQLDVKKVWGEGSDRDFFVSYHPAVEHVTAFLHCCFLFFSVIFHFCVLILGNLHSWI